MKAMVRDEGIAGDQPVGHFAVEAGQVAEQHRNKCLNGSVYIKSLSPA